MVLITCVLATIFHKHLLLQNKLAWNCYWQGQRVNECTPVFYNIKHISAKNIHPLRIFNPEKYSSQKTFTQKIFIPENIDPWKIFIPKNIHPKKYSSLKILTPEKYSLLLSLTLSSQDYSQYNIFVPWTPCFWKI